MPAVRAVGAEAAVGYGTSFSVQIPATAEPGDLLVCFAHSIGGSWSMSGWTLIASEAIQSSYSASFYDYVATFRRICQVGDPGTWVTVNLGAYNTYASGVILAFSDANGATPVANVAESEAAGTATVTAPGASGSAAGALRVDFVSAEYDYGQPTLSAYSGDGTLRHELASASYLKGRIYTGASSPTTPHTLASNVAAAVEGQSFLVMPAVPLAPLLVSPANAATENLGAGFTFDWTHQHSNPAVTQQAWAMRRKIGAGAYEYFNVSTGVFQSTEVFNTGTVDSYTFAAAKWTNGQTYNWSVRTRDVNGQEGPYATDQTVVASTPPTATVTAPTGTVTTTDQPAVTWTVTDPESNPQQNFEVRVEKGTFGATPGSGTAVASSGQVSGTATSWTVPVALENGATHRFFVKVTTLGQASSWAYLDATINLDPPAVPLITATADPANARVLLEVFGRDNLLTANQASFETATTGWAALTGTAIARHTAYYLPPSIRGSASAVAAAATSAVQNVPAGVVNGDALLWFVTLKGSDTAVTPAGWTLANETTNGTAATDTRQLLYTRAASAEPASYTYGPLAGATDIASVMVALEGADVTTVQVAAQANASSATVTAPTITPSGSADYARAEIVAGGINNAAATTMTTGTMTELVDVDSGGATALTVAWNPYGNGTTATGTRAFSASTAGPNVGQHVLIRRSAGPVVIPHGNALLRMSITSATASNRQVQTSTGLAGFAVDPSAPLTLRLRVIAMTDAIARTVGLTFWWYKADGTASTVRATDTSAGSAVGTAVNELTYTITPPSDAAWCAVGPNVLSSGGARYIGETYLIDMVHVGPNGPTQWSRGGLAALTVFDVERSDDGGTTWATLRGGIGVAKDGTTRQKATLYDNEAPFHAERRYRARARAEV